MGDSVLRRWLRPMTRGGNRALTPDRFQIAPNLTKRTIYKRTKHKSSQKSNLNFVFSLKCFDPLNLTTLQKMVFILPASMHSVKTPKQLFPCRNRTNLGLSCCCLAVFQVSYLRNRCNLMKKKTRNKIKTNHNKARKLKFLQTIFIHVSLHSCCFFVSKCMNRCLV